MGRTPVSIARVFAPVLLFFLIVFAEAAVETHREGANGYSGTQDTFLEENTLDNARGTESLVKVENDPPQVQHGLIHFDNIFGNGAGQIPLGSIINSATLTVDVANTSSDGAQIRLHRMLVTWPETATWNAMTNGIHTNDVEAMCWTRYANTRRGQARSTTRSPNLWPRHARPPRGRRSLP